MPALQIIFDKSPGGGIERITTDGQKLPERRERSATSQSFAPREEQMGDRNLERVVKVAQVIGLTTQKLCSQYWLRDQEETYYDAN